MPETFGKFVVGSLKTLEKKKYLKRNVLSAHAFSIWCSLLDRSFPNVAWVLFSKGGDHRLFFKEGVIGGKEFYRVSRRGLDEVRSDF